MQIQALYYARIYWKVDIITMSFGYPRGVHSIREQIKLAVADDILVFAAASNDGGNSSRMFPASEIGVFAIHSTDGNGVASGFNPDAERDENFSILGEHVQSAWLTKDGSVSTRRLSGTSFATPIAVCLSAFVLAYVPRILPDYETYYQKLNTYQGMRNVLQLMATERTGSGGYQYLNAQKYFMKEQSAVREGIKEALSRA